jgi:hypothetical protein
VAAGGGGEGGTDFLSARPRSGGGARRWRGGAPDPAASDFSFIGARHGAGGGGRGRSQVQVRPHGGPLLEPRQAGGEAGGD